MPITREPSQRTKAWVRWNYGQHSSSKTSLASTATEIIHLGGSRVSGPESPTTSSGREQERPCTTWFSPIGPPPQPPIGIARSSTTPHERLSHERFSHERLSPSPSSNSRHSRIEPRDLISPPPSASSRTEPRDVVSPTPSTRSWESISPQMSPEPLKVPSDKIPSPLASATSTSSFSKIISPPPYSSASPPRSDSVPRSVKQLRRTQSATDLQRRGRTQSKELPPKPLGGTPNEFVRPERTTSLATHVGQLIKEDAHEKSIHDKNVEMALNERETQWFPLPPLISPPPSKPLPTVSAISPTSPDDGNPNKSPVVPAEIQQQPDPKAKALPEKPVSRLSPQERLWLHRNYRGEATFLKAWGLSIEKREDREEGVAMMRELMAAEDEKKRAKKAEKARDLGHPDGGLQIIVEEERSTHSEPEKPSPRMLDPQSAAKPQGLRVPTRNYTHPASPTDRHTRSESESSVLGSYLDIRMSRMD
ncbi:hypothetical protein PFICI_00996 [Pestalotiopsis fici W106-1]|uniref:Uncharacterized protein n=1 Tax=Pestalotiopsis fici (strain W106-1 / CGMCC3.15140) TaxID=1229662 RepID=W3XM97_PESFW|nr:uncharacterized protein PFICI_00996 [Pestalotiopsis fici W106-1]ETS87168.1 hypothetical protein PFICI_00996 [Pestalotiopsis fici W106-1]